MISETTSNWSKEELSDIDLGDQRLNKRLLKLADQLAQQPQAVINQACEDWADTKAAYRFFDNEKVTPAHIISAHRNRVIDRMKRFEVVLAIQDTTEIDYTKHPGKKGLGQVGNENGKGLLMHTTLAVTPTGLPLGVLAQQIWVRSKKREQKAYQMKKLLIKEKESQKWLSALEQTMTGIAPGVQVVTVCDREADVFEFLLRAEQLGAAYVVRAASNRALLTTTNCLWQEVVNYPTAGELEVEVAAKKDQPARLAKVSVQYGEVELKPPQRLKKAQMEGWKPIRVWAVYAHEDYPPEGATPLQWMLLTNVAVNNFEDALERIQWYCQRWTI